MLALKTTRIRIGIVLTKMITTVNPLSVVMPKTLAVKHSVEHNAL